jgi:hypothetical protein
MQEFLRQCTVVGLPAILFVCSLHRVFHQGKASEPEPYLGRVWLALYVMVQMVSTVWLAKALSLLSPELIAAPEVVAIALSAGPLFLGTMLLLLYARALPSLPARIFNKFRRRG